MSVDFSEQDCRWMRQSLRLAAQGEGLVEPNPMVGCLLVRGDRCVAQGWHQRFGGPHAEVVALRQASDSVRGSTAYVTLEPCCYHGKTPPCTSALIDAGVSRVVVGCVDPNPRVCRRGLAELAAAGIDAQAGCLEEEARQLIAPFTKLLSTGRPWVHVKWAMTLDGKIASHRGLSRWISGPESRARVHELRGRCDAILVGRATALADDPLLTVRPAGKRVPLRIVLDSQARLPLDSQLVVTAREVPLLIVVGKEAASERCDALRHSGAEVLALPGDCHQDRLEALLDELGRRRMTNLLVEGGGEIHGSLLDAQQIDECHAFIAPRLLGGRAAHTAVKGQGRATMELAESLDWLQVERVGQDVYLRGRVSQIA